MAEQDAKDKYDLLDGTQCPALAWQRTMILLSILVRSAADREDTDLESRHLQAHGVPSVEWRLAREAARLSARRKVERADKESGWSFSSASEKVPVRKKPEQIRRVRRAGESRYEEVEGDVSTKPEYGELNIGLSFFQIVERLPHSSSPVRTGFREIYSSEKDPVVMIEVTSSTKRQEDVTAE